MKDREKEVDALMRLCDGFSKSLSQDMIEAYLEDLAEYLTETVIAACSRARKQCTRWPSIAALREICGQLAGQAQGMGLGGACPENIRERENERAKLCPPGPHRFLSVREKRDELLTWSMRTDIHATTARRCSTMMEWPDEKLDREDLETLAETATIWRVRAETKRSGKESGGRRGAQATRDGRC